MMKNNLIIGFFACSLSLPAFAAVSVNQYEAQGLTKIGVVSLSAFRGSPNEAMEAIREKAINAGAERYRITSFDTPGDSSFIRATAVIYRD
ncbi:DUF1471 domain-containing protein [Erwinia mallotivora]|uniref:DUF1471 domain-containing protein n=1 Tax=Erwinia mallotivora TaxID=69222 RepID=UPI0035E490E6